MDRADEYESAAAWCAKRGIKGNLGDPLPENLSDDVAEDINADPEAFEERVRDYAYAFAMEKLALSEEPTP